MSTTIDDVNKMLFGQMKKLEKNMTPTQLQSEIDKTKGMVSLSGSYAKNVKLKLDAMRIVTSGNYGPNDIPADFCIKKPNKP